MPSVDVPSSSHVGGSYRLVYETPGPPGTQATNVLGTVAGMTGKTIGQLSVEQAPVQIRSQEIRTGTVTMPVQQRPQQIEQPVTRQTVYTTATIAPYGEVPQTMNRPQQSEFGLGVTKKVEQNAPLIPDSAQQTASGRFASVGRYAIVSGANVIDIIGEGAKRGLRGDVIGLGQLGGSVAYSMTIGSAEQVGSIGGSLASGDIGGAAQKTTFFGTNLAVGQAFYSFGKGFATQGFNVAKAGFKPKAFAERYGPTEVVGFARQPLAEARAKAQLEPFRSAPPFSALQEQAAARQARPVAISLTPPVGKITAVQTFTPSGVVYSIKVSDVSGMFERSKFLITTKPMLTPTGEVQSVGMKELAGKFQKSAFKETTLYTEKGAYPAVEKTLNFPPKQTGTDIVRPSGMSRTPYASEQVMTLVETPKDNYKLQQTTTTIKYPPAIISYPKGRYTEPTTIPLTKEYPPAASFQEPKEISYKDTAKGLSLNISIPTTGVSSKLFNPLANPSKSLGGLADLVSNKTNTANLAGFSQITKQIDRPIFTPQTATSTLQSQPQAQRNAQLTREITKQTGGISDRTTADMLLPKEPKLNLGNVNSSKQFAGSGLSKAFSLFVRRRGKFIQTPGVFTRETAIGLGAKLVSGSAAATFKIRQAGFTQPKNQPSPFARERFYTPKTIRRAPGEELFTQRTKYRISSYGEKQEITQKGLAALRRNKRWF